MNHSSASEQQFVFEKFDNEQISSDLVETAAKIFSENYGIWGPLAEAKMGPFAKAGRRVRMTATRLRSQCLPSDARNSHVCVLVDGICVGYVFASHWIYEGKNMCWITQLCVSSSFRRRGLAVELLKYLRQGENDRGFAILSSHPAAIRAALRAFSRCGLEEIDHEMAKQHARAIMASSPVDYVRSARLHGSVFEEHVDDGTISCADTQFFVDHTEILEALEMVKESDICWPYGELPDGNEFLVMVKGKDVDVERR